MSSEQHKKDYTVNIALIGAVSAGKSTLTNLLFVEQFSDMNNKRTTALPQVYYEVVDKTKMSDLSSIRENNRKKNKDIMEKTSSGESTLVIDDIKEVEYFVPKVFVLLTDVLKPSVNLVVYDMPGLNDSKTKNVFIHILVVTMFRS